MKFRLGTRKSALAQIQSRFILKELEQVGVHCELVLVESSGDQNLKSPLYEIEFETPGLFTKQLEDALLRNEIDLAVHSLKDLPTDIAPGLALSCIPKRAATQDCLVIHKDKFVPGSPLHLPEGASVGTSSLRREALLISQRSDLKISPVRGNVPTRIRLVTEGKIDAIMLAAAGLDRLSLTLDGVRRFDLPEDIFVSAPGQGALAVETRKDADPCLLEGLLRIHDTTAETETKTERAVLKGLFGGCTLPFGARCHFDGNLLKCKGFLGVLRDKTQRNHDWKGFHHFDISDASHQTLVSKMVEHFKGQLS